LLLRRLLLRRLLLRRRLRARRLGRRPASRLLLRRAPARGALRRFLALARLEHAHRLHDRAAALGRPAEALVALLVLFRLVAAALVAVVVVQLLTHGDVLDRRDEHAALHDLS